MNTSDKEKIKYTIFLVLAIFWVAQGKEGENEFAENLTLRVLKQGMTKLNLKTFHCYKNIIEIPYDDFIKEFVKSINVTACEAKGEIKTKDAGQAKNIGQNLEKIAKILKWYPHYMGIHITKPDLLKAVNLMDKTTNTIETLDVKFYEKMKKLAKKYPELAEKYTEKYNTVREDALEKCKKYAQEFNECMEKATQNS